jgi:hypothetical protein
LNCTACSSPHVSLTLIDLLDQGFDLSNIVSQEFNFFVGLGDFALDLLLELVVLFLYLSIVSPCGLIKLRVDHSLHGLSETLPLRLIL